MTLASCIHCTASVWSFAFSKRKTKLTTTTKNRPMGNTQELLAQVAPKILLKDHKHFSRHHHLDNQIYLTDKVILLSFDWEDKKPEGRNDGVAAKLREAIIKAFSHAVRINQELPEVGEDANYERHRPGMTLWPNDSTEFEGNRFQNYYLRILHSLPNVKAAYLTEDELMLFTFDGGQGLLKQVRVR